MNFLWLAIIIVYSIFIFFLLRMARFMHDCDEDIRDISSGKKGGGR